ncbi:MAG: 30S ribosomal protein S3 [Candidatus Aenigmatarchaeota archaeon]
MAIERTFIKEGIKESQVEDFLRERFKRAGYSHTEIQRTPIGTRIVVYANKPGLVIGRSGRYVNSITEEIKKMFGFENPMIDVREVENPMMDANIVASRIADSLERGINYKRVCGFYLERVMESGAIGIQIRVAGKMAGRNRSRFQKFREGFIAHSGDYAEKFVDKGYARAALKPGAVGIQVRIMVEAPEDFKKEKKLSGGEEGALVDAGAEGVAGKAEDAAEEATEEVEETKKTDAPAAEETKTEGDKQAADPSGITEPAE